MKTMSLELHPFQNIPLIDEETDITETIKKDNDIQRYDALVIASTIISKSQGRTKALNSFTPNNEAKSISQGSDMDPRFVQAVLEESEELLIEDPFLLAVTRFGHISPNAGIDISNVDGEDRILLLPRNPSESADEISDELGISVIISDTCGRPFRIGQTGVAIGWSGMDPVIDWRGKKDLFGRELEVTREAIADEIAGAANIVMGEGDRGTPIIGVKGLDRHLDMSGEDTLFREEQDDIVRRSLRETMKKEMD